MLSRVMRFSEPPVQRTAPALAFLLLLAFGCAPRLSAVPPEAGGSVQQILLSPLEADTNIAKGGWKLDKLSAEPAPAAEVTPKLGAAAMRLSGDAEVAGAKGDFTLNASVPGACRSLALWVYLTPQANVQSVGFQIYDAEGEALLFQVPADWTGWKQVTLDVQNGPLTQAYDQADKNKKADFPLAGVHFAWFAKAAGPTSLAIDALTATTQWADAPTGTLDAQMTGANWGETNTLFAPQLLALTNFTAQSRTAKVQYQIQRDPALFSDAPPDPVFGRDRALGATSWTEAEGKTLGHDTLTDGKVWTNAALPWGSHKEAFQYIDLGQERTITRLGYQAADANWAWKLDIAASPDGKTYTDVPGLQNIDTHGHWGENVIPVPKPFTARFLRLRHHNGGQDVNQIIMPSGFSVFTGAADETWAFPNVGETIAHGDQTQNVPAHAFTTIELKGDGKPLGPGAYLLAARVNDGARTQLVYRHFFIMPAPLSSVADSRFGLNAANYEWAKINRRLGIGWVRFENMKWPMISPAPNVYNFHGNPPWNLEHDEIVKAYLSQGIQFLPFLFQTPDYATSAPENVTKNRDSYPPKDNAQMADFVFQTVARYGAKTHPASELKTADKKSGLNEIHTYEIWNEPNLTDPGWGPWVGTTAQYNAMFRAAAEAVKRADPTAHVTNGGFAGIDVETLNTLLTPYADGKTPLDYVDVLNVHYYSGRVAPELAVNDPNANRSGNAKGVRTFEEDLQRLIAWRDTHKPGLPIWMSETGYDSAGPFGTDLRTQAARLPRVIMTILASGVDKVFVYRESGSTPSMHAASGVMDNDGALKPSWFTYATLIRELDGVKTGATRLPYPDPNVRLYAWTRGTETLLTAWAIDVTTKLNLKLGPCTVTDAFGNARRQTLTAGLSLSVYPTYIEKIGNLTAVKALLAQAERAETARRQESARQAKLRAYLFDFGSTDKVGTIDIGSTRTFTPVLGADVYNGTRGYGFWPKAAGPDNVSGWINDPLDRDSTRMNPDASFRVHALPGRYKLTVSIGPQSAGHLTVKGAVGGDQIFPITRDGPPVTADIQVGPDPLTFSNDAYGDIRWLTLIQR